MSPTEAKRDILLALTQLSLGRLLLSRAYLRFAGQIKWYRSNAAEETKRIHDILFALPCLRKPGAHSSYPLILLKSLEFKRHASEHRGEQRRKFVWSLLPLSSTSTSTKMQAEVGLLAE